MTWNECLSLGKEYNTIIITGCQRTGTTYTAQELSRELGYRHYDEDDYGVHSIEGLRGIMDHDPSPKVIQAPALLHEMGSMGEDVLVILMTRNEDEVVSSMVKHEWIKREGKREYNKFKEGTPTDGYEIYRTKTSFGRGLNLPEMDYSELRKTTGYIENREGFDIKQTKRG